MTSNVPRAREILQEVRDDLEGVHHLERHKERIDEALALMVRRSPARRAPTRHRPLSERQREAVRAYIRAHPEAHLADVAHIFNVNPGRISECLE